MRPPAAVQTQRWPRRTRGGIVWTSQTLQNRQLFQTVRACGQQEKRRRETCTMRTALLKSWSKQHVRSVRPQCPVTARALSYIPVATMDSVVTEGREEADDRFETARITAAVDALAEKHA